MASSISPPERPLLGVILRCAAATMFAMMGALLKYASLNGASLIDLMFYRSFGMLPVVLIAAAFGGGIAQFGTKHPLAHLTRSLLGLVGMFVTFGALALLPLGTATALTYSSAISATILTALFLSEAVGWRRWSAVLVGFGGVILVTRPGGMHLSGLGIASGLAASLAQASVSITLRQIGKTERPIAIVFWFTILCSVCTGIALPWFGVRHDWGTTGILMAAGVAGGIGQFAITGSVRYAPVSAVVPFDYIQIIWATLFGWLLFDTAPPATMLAGALLITGSGIYTAYREQKRGRMPLELATMPEA